MGFPSTDTSALGDILKFAEIISIVGTGIFVVFKVGRATERFELIGQQQAKEISELKDTVKEIAKAQVIAQSEKIRLDNQGTLIAEMRKEINMLRMGKGFIREYIDGEWPHEVASANQR